MKTRFEWCFVAFFIGCSTVVPPADAPTPAGVVESSAPEVSSPEPAPTLREGSPVEARHAPTFSEEDIRAQKRAFVAFLDRLKRCEPSSTVLRSELELMGKKLRFREVFEVLDGTPEECRLRRQTEVESSETAAETLAPLLALDGDPAHSKRNREEFLARGKEMGERRQLCEGRSDALVERFALYHQGVTTTPVDDKLCEIVGMDCGEEPRLATHCRISACRNGSWQAECKDSNGTRSSCSLGWGPAPDGMEASCVGSGAAHRATSNSP